jgi:hypothetical protein
MTGTVRKRVVKAKMSLGEEYWCEACGSVNGFRFYSDTAKQFRKTMQSVVMTIVLLCMVAVVVAAIL